MRKFRRKLSNIVLIRRFRNYQGFMHYKKKAKMFRKNPSMFLKREFERSLGYPLNLDKPTTFNEKMQWLKLNYRNELAQICADKFLVRKYISDCGYEELLNELYGVYSSFEEINFSELPEKFVIKCTHGSGMNFICKDKKEINYKILKENFDYFMKIDYSLIGGEWVYNFDNRKIIVEKYLEELEGDLLDYKIMCFNGEAKYIYVVSNRGNSGGLNIDYFDTNWNHLDVKQHYSKHLGEIEKPLKLEEMIIIAENLAKDFPFVRIDLYEIENKIFFGEMTFFPSGGLKEFEPQSFDTLMGECLKIDELVKTRG